MENNIQGPEEPFYYDERVDVINRKDGRVMDAQIVSMRGSILVVRYKDTHEEENIHLEDNLILKRWRPGRPFLRLNRLDIKNSTNNKWYEAVIVDLMEDKVCVRYQIPSEGKILEEWLNKDSNNIAPVGKYTNKFNPSLHTPEEINCFLTRKKKFYQTSENQEKKFREEMKAISFKIKEIQGDGNCLYRAVSDQIYGTENFYDIVKAKCLDYLELERDFFAQFIEGGIEKFDEYILMKRMDGVWGDDIEIQALSEIYNRSVEIYSHSKEPLKTFHENSGSYMRGYEREDKQKAYPIRLSYHGSAHYNSLVPIDTFHAFKNSFIKSPAGEYENSILEKVKIKNIQDKMNAISLGPDSTLINNKNSLDTNIQDQNQISIDISAKHDIGSGTVDNEKVKLEMSRGNFIEKNLKDLDSILAEKLSSSSTDKGSSSPKNMNDAIKQSEDFATEQELLNSVLEMSKKEVQVIHQEPDIMTMHPSVKFILEMGFTLEEAVLAYSAVGDDPDLMLQYLYSMNC